MIELELQLFLNFAPAAVAMFDREMRYLCASRRWLDYFKLNQDVIGRSHYAVFPDIPERWKAIHRRALAGDALREEEDRFERADGSVCWLRWEVRPWRGRDGEIGGIAIFFEDIAERRRAEQALRESEERFRAIFEKAGNGIAIADLEGRVRQANPAFCKMLGYEKEELLGRRAFDLVHPDDQAVNMQQFQRLRLGEVSALEFDHRYLKKDGEAVWVHKSASLLLDECGLHAAVLAMITDITERRRMEQALRNADRRKDEFLATLAHELRNPLAPIRNAVYVLQRSIGEQPETKERARPLIEMIERQVDHLVHLVDDLLEVSRITTGKIALRKHCFDITDAVHRAVEISEPLIRSGQHKISLSLSERPLIVDGDPLRLSQVFANIFNNAAKYTPRGGHIEVSLRDVADQAVVTVRDNGMGISSEMLPRVFDLFTQSGCGFGREQGGLGIGLALVRSLVETHGGAVQARSEGPDKGSEFVVRLPLVAASALDEKILHGKSTPLSSLVYRKILIVDDHKDAADSLAILLQTLGVNVRVTHSGAEAIAAIPEFKPELVFLDIGMPSIDGCETARRIRQLPQGKSLTLAALSGWGREEDRKRTSEAGFDRHYVKPITLDALRALLAPDCPE